MHVVGELLTVVEIKLITHVLCVRLLMLADQKPTTIYLSPQFNDKMFKFLPPHEITTVGFSLKIATPPLRCGERERSISAEEYPPASRILFLYDGRKEMHRSL